MKPRSSSLLGLALGASLLSPPGLVAQTVWNGTATDVWSDNNKWLPTTAPNLADATAKIDGTTTGKVLVDGSFIVGTLDFDRAGTIETSPTGFDPAKGLTLAVNSGTPVIDASGGDVFYYAGLFGSQGFSKTGGSKFTFRYNTLAQTYTGDILVTGGILGINQNSSLGDDANDVYLSTGARLLAEPGSGTGTITLPASRSIFLNGAQAQLGSSPAVVNMVIQGDVEAYVSGAGLVKTDGGKVTLEGNLSYDGDTRIAGGILALAGSAVLPTTTNLRFNSTGGTLDVGSTSQTVNSLVFDNTTAGTRFITGATGSLTINGSPNFSVNGADLLRLDMSGLSSFTYNSSTSDFIVRPATATTNQTVTADFAATGLGSNEITADEVFIGGASGTSQGAAHQGRLYLGQTNTFNANLMRIGGFNGSGLAEFRAGLTGASLKLRGTSGGDSALPILTIGETSSGTRSGAGTLNLTNGSLDAVVTDVVIGRHISNSNDPGTTSVLTMPDGTLSVTNAILLGDKSGSGTPTITATLTQQGGTVSATSLLLGKTTDGTAPNLAAAGQRMTLTYNLNGGSLTVAEIKSGPEATPVVDTAQVETATAVGTTTANGNVLVTVTGAGITGSPLVIPVAVLNGDTADVWAGKVRDALAATSAITALYTAGGTGASIVLTRNVTGLQDGTLNIALANDGDPGPGITAAATSANTIIGAATFRNVNWTKGTLAAPSGADLTVSGKVSIQLPVSADTRTLTADAGRKVVVGAASGNPTTLAVQIDSSGTPASGNLTSSADIELLATAALSVADVAATPVALAAGTKLVLIDYTGKSLTGTFAGLADGATVNVTKDAVTNSFVLDYDDTMGGSGSFVTLTISGVVSDAYADWIDGYFPGSVDPLEIGFDADPDKDGLSNGVEFVTGSVPKNDGSMTKRPTIKSVGTDLVLEFRRVKAARYLGYVVQFNMDLRETWGTVPGSNISELTDGYEADVDKITATLPRGTDLKKFMRLVISPPPGS